jgi:hypothetical protein
VLDTSGNLGIGTSSIPTVGSTTVLAVGNSNGGTLGIVQSGSIAYRISASTSGVDCFNPNSSPISWYTNGTERMRLDSSGNLGIGTSSPSTRLHVVSSGNPTITLAGSDGAYSSIFSMVAAGGGSSVINANGGQNTLLLQTNSTTKAVLDSSGNLGIGTSSPLTPLYVRKDQAAATYVTVDNVGTVGASTSAGFACAEGGTVQGFFRSLRDGSGQIQLYNAGAYPLVFGTGNTERARIDSSGNLLVGKTDVTVTTNGVTIGAANYVASSRNNDTAGFFTRSGTDGSAVVFYKDTTVVGSISVTGTLTSYNVTSDQRLKENIVDAPEFGSVIDSIKVRSYDWKTDQTHQRAGFIAQELVTVAPEAVHQPADPEEMMAVDYSKLVPMLVKEIQSLRARLAAANI